MIQSENAPTLCCSCVHFTKGAYPDCRIGNYGVEGYEAEQIRVWHRELLDESSWSRTGLCPGFRFTGDTRFMTSDEKLSLRRFLLRED